MASVAHQHVLQHPSTAAACAEQTQEAAHHDVQVLHHGICRSEFIGICGWHAGRDLGAAHSRVIRELGADDRHFDIVVAHFQGALMHLKVDQVRAGMCAGCHSWL